VRSEHCGGTGDIDSDQLRGRRNHLRYRKPGDELKHLYDMPVRVERDRKHAWDRAQRSVQNSHRLSLELIH